MSQSEKDKYKVLNRQQDYEDEMTNFEKEFSAMKIPDVSTFKTADEMILNCMSYKCTFIKVNHNDREAKLRFAERNVNDFKIYKRKNIAADQNQKSILDAFYATFQLMVTQLKLHLDKITIQEVDFHQIKDQLIVVFECKSFEFFHHYIRYVVEDLLIDMLKLTYLKTARVFLNLSIHILDCIQKVNGKVTKQRVKSPQSASINENILFAENKYFGSLLYVSCQMMQKDSSWTEEQDAQEQIFEDLLKKLGVEDNYEDIPEMIKTTKQSEKFWKMYLPKIEKYEKSFRYVNDKSDKVTKCQHHCPLQCRAEAYFALAAFQKDGLKKAELSEQSMKLYSKLLEEIFKEEMIQQYMQKDDKLLLHNYSVIIRQVFENYKIVIGAKVDYLMNLPSHSDEIKLRLKELNVLRRDYAVHMITLEKFAKIKPELYNHDLLMRLYYDIATQFRSIILNHPKNQQQNLEQSYPYMIQFYYSTNSRSDLGGLWSMLNNIVGSSPQGIGDAVADQIDMNPFIRKFRQDSK